MPTFNPEQVREMNFAMQIQSVLSASVHTLQMAEQPESIKATYDFKTGAVSYDFTPAPIPKVK